MPSALKSLPPGPSAFKQCYSLDENNDTSLIITFLQQGITLFNLVLGLPQWLSGKESACNAADAGSILGEGRSPGERNGDPLQVFLPGETHGQRSLEGYSQWGLKRVGHELASNSNKNLALRRPILRAKAAKFVITGQVNDDKETVEDEVSLSVASSIHLLSIISYVFFSLLSYIQN